MHVFQRETYLQAEVDAVFAFHENPHNIRKISPWFLRISKVSAQAQAEKGGVFTLHLRIFGLPLTWSGTWAEVRRPNLLIDEAHLFPFQIWRHEHRFETCTSGARMIDIVTYRLPCGWLGRLLGATLARLPLALMFAGRHLATRDYFANFSSP